MEAVMDLLDLCHSLFLLFVSLSLFLSFFLSFSLSVALSSSLAHEGILSLSVGRSVYFELSLSHFSLRFSLSFFLSLSLFLSRFLSFFLLSLTHQDSVMEAERKRGRFAFRSRTD